MANATKLNAAVDQLRDLEEKVSVFENGQEKQAKVNHYLRAKVGDLQEQLVAVLERIQFLECVLELEDPVEQERGSGAEEDGEDAGQSANHDRAVVSGVEARESDGVKHEVSQELAKSKVIKDVVNESFKLLMGVKKLGVEYLPGFPFGMDASSFPKDATGNPLVRFDWKHGPDHSINSSTLDRIYDHVKSNGPSLMPAAASALSTIHAGDLKAKVVQRYTYMSTQWKKKQKLDEEAERKAEEAAEQAAADGIIEAIEADARRLSTSVKNSRGGAKLEQRLRKRANSAFKDPKYDAAFTLAAMSADEDEVDPLPGSTKKYISRAPDYRSELVQTLYTEIDELVDPLPDKAKSMTTRIRGANLLGSEPPKSKKLKNKIRVWQIRSDLLEKNPHWASTGRIAANGVAWGDEVDPVDVEAEKIKEKLNEQVLKVSVDKSKKRKRAEAGKSGQGKARMDEILDGADEDALFDV